MERRTLTLMASAFGLAIAVTGTPAAAQTMYKWVDKDGKTNYTDSPPPAFGAASAFVSGGGGISV